MKALFLDGQLETTADDGKAETGAGRWVVSAGMDGLHVLLTVPSERYVMAAVSGEAAPGESIESLKALAVTARSFALTNPGRHGSEGLCDSTHCQALRMGHVPDIVRAAVLETAGETLWSGSRQVAGYFTQNCGGEAADAAEVWGGQQQSWLIAHSDIFCRRQPALWHAEVGEGKLYDALQAEGWQMPRPLQSIKIARRESSGRASRIELAGAGQKLTLNAASFRFAVDRSLGWSQIRSDWYAVHLDPISREVLFDGKGYGHGVGLCQAGAAEMVREGKSYREILAFYFPGTKLRIVSTDDGWKNFAGQGWTLRGSTTPEAVIAAGDRALVQARERWGAGPVVHPVVTLAPNTELFRQITTAPGWELASTRGSEITLQPLNVLVRHGDLESLLRHEFLHSMVESEANAATPLWLREGFVELLAGEQHCEAVTMPSAELDEALQHANTLRQAQRAHVAACALVGGLVTRYGMASVRSWLRSGVPNSALAGK